MTGKRTAIHMLDGFEIDDQGQIYSAKTGSVCKSMPIGEAVKVWNKVAWAKNLKSPFLEGVGTSRSNSNRTLTTVDGLVRGNKVAWLYLTPEIRDSLSKIDETVCFAIPEEWIDVSGDTSSGWFIIHTNEYQSLLHGPSVLHHLIRV